MPPDNRLDVDSVVEQKSEERYRMIKKMWPALDWLSILQLSIYLAYGIPKSSPEVGHDDELSHQCERIDNSKEFPSSEDKILLCVCTPLPSIWIAYKAAEEGGNKAQVHSPDSQELEFGEERLAKDIAQGNHEQDHSEEGYSEGNHTFLLTTGTTIVGVSLLLEKLLLAMPQPVINPLPKCLRSVRGRNEDFVGLLINLILAIRRH